MALITSDFGRKVSVFLKSARDGTDINLIPHSHQPEWRRRRREVRAAPNPGRGTCLPSHSPKAARAAPPGRCMDCIPKR